MTNELAETTVQRDEWKRIAEDRGIELERLRADISQSRTAIEQLHAAVKTAQELAATRLMEIERLQKRLDRINEKWPHVTEVERLRDALKRVRRVAAEGTTHTGMIAALGILVDRTLNPGNGPLPPDYTYRSDEPRACAHAFGTGRICIHCKVAECECVFNDTHGVHALTCRHYIPPQGASQSSLFDSAAILAAPRERRISMSFQTQEQYEAALVFLGMADRDTPAGQRWVERSAEESDRMLAASFHKTLARSPRIISQGATQAINSIDDVAAICHSVTGLCCHILGSPGGPCTIGNCAAVRGYLGGPEFAQGASRDASSAREEVERRAMELRETGVKLIPNSWRCQHGTVYAWPIAVAVCGCDRDSQRT